MEVTSAPSQLEIRDGEVIESPLPYRHILPLPGVPSGFLHHGKNPAKMLTLHILQEIVT